MNYGDVLILYVKKEIRAENKYYEWILHDDGFTYSDPHCIPKQSSKASSADKNLNLCLFRVEPIKNYKEDLQ